MQIWPCIENTEDGWKEPRVSENRSPRTTLNWLSFAPPKVFRWALWHPLLTQQILADDSHEIRKCCVVSSKCNTFLFSRKSCISNIFDQVQPQNPCLRRSKLELYLAKSNRFIYTKSMEQKASFCVVQQFLMRGFGSTGFALAKQIRNN